jgi:hypothetical protein
MEQSWQVVRNTSEVRKEDKPVIITTSSSRGDAAVSTGRITTARGSTWGGRALFTTELSPV